MSTEGDKAATSDQTGDAEKRSQKFERNANILFWAGLILALFVFVPIGCRWIEDWGVLGDYIGGITGSLWAAAVFFLLRASLTTQREELSKTHEALESQKLEMRKQLEEMKEQGGIMQTTQVLEQVQRIIQAMPKSMERAKIQTVDRQNHWSSFGAIQEATSRFQGANSLEDMTTIPTAGFESWKKSTEVAMATIMEITASSKPEVQRIVPILFRAGLAWEPQFLLVCLAIDDEDSVVWQDGARELFGIDDVLGIIDNPSLIEEIKKRLGYISE